jgi:hypothetical protein
MLPTFDATGNLPPGIHWATWTEFAARFGTTVRRRALLLGLKAALDALRSAGCPTVYVDGSFVTHKTAPQDFDACWESTRVDPARLDPVFLDFGDSRAAQKAKFLGEFFPADWPEGATGKTFLAFFQTDRHSGQLKGIVAIDLGGLP